MTTLLGDIAPNFKNINTTQGIIDDFHSWAGDSWVILFSHPKDFTPVCTTELGFLAKIKAEFDRRNVKLLALSVDDIESHLSWIKDIEELHHCEVTYPIIADDKRIVANLYNMIHPNELQNLTVRSVFIIDPDKKIRLSINYPASTGRNFNEILRVVDSLQLTSYHQVATPANWTQGNDCIVVPSLSDKDAQQIFSEIKHVKPYLRYTKQPESSLPK